MIRSSTDIADPRDLFAGGSEMAAVMRAVDWSATPLGPVEGWSQALRTMVGLLLRNRFAMLLWWGPQFVQLYNDAYRPVLGDKHPRSMGQPDARVLVGDLAHHRADDRGAVPRRARHERATICSC